MSSSSEPLIRPNEGAIVQTLGEHTFTCNPSRFDNTVPLWKTILTSCFKLSVLPIVIPTMTVYTTTMWLGPKWYKQFMISKFIPIVMAAVNTKFELERNELLRIIHPKYCRTSENQEIKVLDVGCGGGHYMKYLCHATEVVALEPVVRLHKVIRKRAMEDGKFEEIITPSQQPQPQAQAQEQEMPPNENAVTTHDSENKKKKKRVLVLDTIVQDYVSQNPNCKETFDYVILGNVLCEIDYDDYTPHNNNCHHENNHEDASSTITNTNPLTTLQCIDLLLKPGGYIYFSEHIGQPQGTFLRTVQNWINPIWRIVGGGCNCNHDSLLHIQNMKNWNVIYWQYDSMKVGFGPFVLGLAQKQK